MMLFLLIGESTSLDQLIKIPKLYAHFIEHKALNPSVSFVSYLSMHYWGEDLNDDDDDKDMQLPFKKYDFHTPGFLFVPASKIFAIKTQSWIVKTDFGPEKSQVYCNPALDSLFRPPRA